LDLAEHYNKTIAKSAGNPLTSLLPCSLPPISLLPASSPPAASKKFDYCYAFASLKRQADRITV